MSVTRIENSLKRWVHKKMYLAVGALATVWLIFETCLEKILAITPPENDALFLGKVVFNIGYLGGWCAMGAMGIGVVFCISQAISDRSDAQAQAEVASAAVPTPSPPNTQ